MGNNSATSNDETPAETAAGDGNSENALPVGLLVVNGFDVLKHIADLEKHVNELQTKVSELETKLGAANNAAPSADNDAMA